VVGIALVESHHHIFERALVVGNLIAWRKAIGDVPDRYGEF